MLNLSGDSLHSTLEQIKNEGEILKYWKEGKILDRLRARNKGNRIFFFLEGPPYANGELHLGHIRGYTRKDAILRYKRMRGYDVFDRAGFDVHGLPIENKVEREMGISSKKDIETKIGVKEFVAECIKAYEKYVPMQVDVALRYGVWFDFENAYIPAKPEYINRSFRIFKKIYEKKLVYKGIKVMPYCLHCGTVLAKGPEIEEEQDTDPSVFVVFKTDIKRSKPKIKLDENTYLLVWTTTPWTLPANMSIAANPKVMYVRASAGDRELILAKDLLDQVAKQCGMSIVVKEEFYGSELEGIYYLNPMEQFIPKQKETRKYHRIIFSEELVSTTDGTGLVHIAPAFGPEDFSLAQKEKIPLLSIVDTDGKYNADAGKYAGIKLIHEANKEIEKELEGIGAMLGKSTISHSYPHCWRCHEKLVYLPTEQWFINVAKLKKKIIRACDKVQWHPQQLKDWFIESINTSPDWAISRQRYWDIPIPIWVCKNCKETEVIGSFEELKSKSSGINFTSHDLHMPVIDEVTFKCKKCGGEMHRIRDVFDVWYDSGVAHTASLTDEEFKAMFPNAFITEGPDQLRGWFATLMKTSVAVYGKSPFKTILMHGWVVDSKGEAMHKSKGNYISGQDLLGKYPTDAIRAFMLSHIIPENLKFSSSEIEDAQAVLMLLHNIANLLDEYADSAGGAARIKKPNNLENMQLYNAWIVSRLNTVIKEMTEGMESYEINNGVVRVLKFVVEDFSRFYLKIAKKRIVESGRKEAKETLNTIDYVLYNLILLLAPVTPFNSEQIYLNRYKFCESVFFEKWPKANEKLIDEKLEKKFDAASEAITALLSARDKAGIKLRQPISKAVLEIKSDEVAESLKELSELVKDYANAKELDVHLVSGIEKEIVPLFSAIGPEFKSNANAVADALRSANAKELENAVEGSGHYTLDTGRGAFDIRKDHFSIVEKKQSSDAVMFKYGLASIDKTISKELLEEAMVRDFERGIQLQRKKLALRKADKINVEYEANETMADLIKMNAQKIKKDVGANELRAGHSSEMTEIEVGEEKIKASITKV